MQKFATEMTVSELKIAQNELRRRQEIARLVREDFLREEGARFRTVERCGIAGIVLGVVTALFFSDAVAVWATTHKPVFFVSFAILFPSLMYFTIRMINYSFQENLRLREKFREKFPEHADTLNPLIR